MFTGIIQALGVVRSISRTSAGARLVVDAPDVSRPIIDGASICTCGACLTVVRSDDRMIEFDVVPETLSRTRVGKLNAGDKVNLEPSLRIGDAIDGHTVQGHVDGLAVVKAISKAGQEHVITFRPDAALMPYIIPKGSIAIDGVSLTIAATDRETFQVAVIPTTLAWTTLGDLRVGHTVNIETDILARTIVTTLERWKSQQAGSGVTMAMLRDGGFA